MKPSYVFGHSENLSHEPRWLFLKDLHIWPLCALFCLNIVRLSGEQVRSVVGYHGGVKCELGCSTADAEWSLESWIWDDFFLLSLICIKIRSCYKKRRRCVIASLFLHHPSQNHRPDANVVPGKCNCVQAVRIPSIGTVRDPFFVLFHSMISW